MNDLRGNHTCSVCRQPIVADDDVMAYRRTLKDPNEYAHRECAASDSAAVMKIATTYGHRGLRALR